MKKWAFDFEQPNWEEAPEGATHFAVYSPANMISCDPWVRFNEGHWEFYCKEQDAWLYDSEYKLMYTNHNISDYYEASQEQKAESFKRELKALFDKYDAHIEAWMDESGYPELVLYCNSYKVLSLEYEINSDDL